MVIFYIFLYKQSIICHNDDVGTCYVLICTIRHSQLLASLQAWCHWIARRSEKAKETLCQRCIDSCIWATTYTASCDHSPPANLIHSAIHLFQSITAILKPILWDQPTFRNLISMGTYPYLKSDTIKVLRRALINGIILPPGDAVTRQRLLGKLGNYFVNLCNCLIIFFFNKNNK